MLLHGGAKPVPVAEPLESDKSKAPKAPLGDDLDGPDIASRMAAKVFYAFHDPANPGASEPIRAQLVAAVDPALAQNATSAVRLIPAYVEVEGVTEGSKAIENARTRIDDDKTLTTEQRAVLDETLDDLDGLYSLGSANLPKTTRERLEQRLGWSGRLALSFDLPSKDPMREEMLSGGGMLLAFLVCVGLGALAAVVAGFVLFTVAAVLIGKGKLRWRMDKPALGGSLGVEVLTVFLGAFLGLKLVMSLVHAAVEAGWLGTWLKAQGEQGMVVMTLVAQWIILPLVMLYPAWRGYPRSRVKRALGWHRGRGFLVEMLAGVAGYLACIPVYILAVLIAFGLMMLEHALRTNLSGGQEPGGPVNPIGDLLSQSALMAVLLIALATVWAPIVEESVFRGAMFRQLNARMGMVWAALISGTVFAMMHGYSASMFPPLIALGAGFALIRAWRGSLVACVTAHALHNGTVTIVMLVMFSLLK
ncbi:MAG: CPBP family intramembrane metalloprotease [Phycisphaerales bacterium]